MDLESLVLLISVLLRLCCRIIFLEKISFSDIYAVWNVLYFIKKSFKNDIAALRKVA